MSEPRICEKDGHNFLPLFRNAEQEWPDPLRFILYLLGLGWAFMGVGIASDLFMGAIEEITSKTKRVVNHKTGRVVTTKVWNDTVANLTLMALGSSAPEILLSVIELLSNEFFAGDLGPSTIVGSAAFNLLCIIAVCVSAIPDGDTRKIKEMPVYCITAGCSIFAYLWLVFILLGPSPNVVEIWEAVLTFLFFPLLVTIAFLADRGLFTGGKESSSGSHIGAANMSKVELAELKVQIQARHKRELKPDELLKIIDVEYGKPQSYAAHRVAATRKVFGGKQIEIKKPKGSGTQWFKQFTMSPKQIKKQQVAPIDDEALPQKQEVKFSFAAARYGVHEHHDKVLLSVKRTGDMKGTAIVNYKTRDGEAQAGSDYTAVAGTLIFKPNEAELPLEVKILDDNAYEDDEEFSVILEEPIYKIDDVVVPNGAQLGDIPEATVVIIDDDAPGIIYFEHDVLRIEEGSTDKAEKIRLIRKAGSSGVISCKCTTRDGSAKEDVDFEKVDETITFGKGETEKEVTVTIKARGRYGITESFQLVLTDPTGGTKFDAEHDGDEKETACNIDITNGQANKDTIDRLESKLRANWEKSKLAHSNWREQFKNALYVNGGEEEDDDESPTCFQYFMHAITLPWKLLLALVPPVDYCGGWLCFVCSLLAIGLITAFIGDLAALVGCVTHVIPDSVTAITLVALGTSLPDTFASKTAATQDPYADASIGNVTGSNSVNVFLGLGMPWTMGALYWTIGGKNSRWEAKYANKIGPGLDISSDFKDGAFVVIAGTLASNIIVFCCCAMTCIAILYVRRKLFKAELGGPAVPKYITSGVLVTLWVIYVTVSSILAIVAE